MKAARPSAVTSGGTHHRSVRRWRAEMAARPGERTPRRAGAESLSDGSVLVGVVPVAKEDSEGTGEGAGGAPDAGAGSRRGGYGAWRCGEPSPSSSASAHSPRSYGASGMVTISTF